jgi:SAM-dependent methyltransferase
VADPVFRSDLYRGTAECYDAYRPPYPEALIDDLAGRTGADGAGRLLDLACGTGQVAFALRDSFAEIWLADQEPGMIAVARRKAAGDTPRFRFVTGAAEHLDLPSGTFDLATIGNAFHRLGRDAVAANVRRWLAPGGHLALLWGDGPAAGNAPWQQTLQVVTQHWQTRNGADDRIPAGYAGARRDRPDAEVLAAAGLEIVATGEASADKLWTLEELTGFLASTSVLSDAALGASAADFDRDVRDALQSCQPDGGFRQVVTFSYQLARVSPPAPTGLPPGARSRRRRL